MAIASRALFPQPLLRALPVMFMLLLFSFIQHSSALASDPALQTESDGGLNTLQVLPPVLNLNMPGDFSIGRHSQWLEDPHRSLTPDAAMLTDSWQNSKSDSLNFGFSDSAFWLRTPLSTGSLDDWYLWNRYSLLDQVDMYLCPRPYNNSSECVHKQAGDLQPFDINRDVSHPNTIIHLPTDKGHDYLLLLRVETHGTYQLPASLVDSQTLHNELLMNNILRGGYYATMLVMGLYNLFIFFATRERSYFYYSAFVLSFLLFHMTYEGSAFQFFWPELPMINNSAFLLAFSVNQLILCFFVPNFLRLKQHSPAAYRLFRVYTAITLVTLLMIPLLHYEVMVPINNLLSMLITASALIVSIRVWIGGESAARFFTIAWMMLITGLILANARSLGLIPTNTFTLYAYQIGSFMEVILLSLALGERIMRLQKDQLAARKAMLKSQEDAIQYLRDYEDLYQNSLTGKFQLDEEGFFLKTNPAWRTMLGYSEQNHFSNDNPSFDSLIAEASQRRALWRKLRDSGRVQAFVVAIIQPLTGERLMVSLTIRKRAPGERAAWIGSGQNVTEQYQQEQELMHLQKEKTLALRQLVMGIAHEMNTPLGNIRLAESFLTEHHDDWSADEAQQQLQQGLVHIHDGIERLNSLNQLMKNAVVLENQYASEIIELRPWLEQWRNTNSQQHPQVKLRTGIHSYLTEWQTYPEALDIILNQLVDNSCVHNREQEAEGKLQISVDLRERGEHLELHYQDNGKGIDAEQREAIFMPFYTTQRSSARSKGLGLYQTYNLLTELLHGHIDWPDDAEGFYLVVRFPLPAEHNDSGA